MVDYLQIKKEYPHIFQYFCSYEKNEDRIHYFDQFDEIRPIYKGFFAFIEENLSLIDSDENSKNIFKEKCDKYIFSKEKNWSRFIDTLNELEGYKYLKREIKCLKVDFIKENNKTKTPDLEGLLNNKKYYLEVKTIHISDKEKQFILSKDDIRDVSQELEKNLFDPKLKVTIDKAQSQLSSISDNSDLKILLLVISLDSDAPETIKKFTEQIKDYVKNALSKLINFEFIIKYKQNGIIFSHEEYQKKFGL